MHMEDLVRQISNSTKFSEISEYLDQKVADVLAEAIMIQQIPGPTFSELVRANHVLSRLGGFGLTDTTIDDVYNAYGRLAGRNPDARALLISAHTDTVFSSETDLTIRRDKANRIYGPGLGDNSLGVAGLIALADTLQHFEIEPEHDIWFLANSREEGMGDLGGIRAFHDEHGKHIGRAIVLEGMALGRIYNSGIAVRRFHVTCTAPGGHSWHDFGRPSAIHTLMRIGAELTEIDPPETPRTTYNIGVIEGGRSINSLATSAGFYLDMRSESAAQLDTLEAQVRHIIEKNHQHDGASVQVEVVGNRPSGSIEPDHDLVRSARAALQHIKMAAHLETGSTDANLLLARGVPTVTIGLTHGGNAHRTDEFIDTKPLATGMKQFLLLVLAAAGWQTN